MAQGLPAGSLGAAVAAFLAAVSAVIFLRMTGRLLLGGEGRVWTGAFGPAEAAVAAGLIALFAMLLSGGARSGAGAEAGEITIGALVAGGMFQAGLCAAVLLLLKLRGHRVGRLAGLEAMGFGRQMAWAVFFLAASLPLLDLLSRVSVALHGGEPEPQAIVNFARGNRTPDEQLAVILFAVALAPVTEEFLFRGFLYPALKSFLGPFAGALLAAGLFGMIHMNAQAFLPLAALGLVMTLAYERTGSLLVPMLAHALFNAASLVAMRLPLEPPTL